MACYLCQIPKSVSPLSDLGTAAGATPSTDTTIMLACGNCNVNDFGPALPSAQAPSFKISTKVTTKLVPGLT